MMGIFIELAWFVIAIGITSVLYWISKGIYMESKAFEVELEKAKMPQFSMPDGCSEFQDLMIEKIKADIDTSKGTITMKMIRDEIKKQAKK